MRRIAIGMLAVGCCVSGMATTPAGFYTILGGGGDYLINAALNDTNITRIDLDPFTHNYVINYSQQNSFGYTVRGELGYLFSSLDQKQSYGLEIGYNYFGAIDSQFDNSFIVPLVDVTHHVTTNETTTTWSTDLEGVYVRQIVPHFNMMIKLGVAYQNMTNSITNTVDVPEFPSSVSVTNNGVGGAGGIGLQYIPVKHVGIQGEVDGMKGGTGIGYGQVLLGVMVIF